MKGMLTKKILWSFPQQDRYWLFIPWRFCGDMASNGCPNWGSVGPVLQLCLSSQDWNAAQTYCQMTLPTYESEAWLSHKKTTLLDFLIYRLVCWTKTWKVTLSYLFCIKLFHLSSFYGRNPENNGFTYDWSDDFVWCRSIWVIFPTLGAPVLHSREAGVVSDPNLPSSGIYDDVVKWLSCLF